MISPVREIRKRTILIRANRKIHRLQQRIAMEELLVCGVDPGFDLSLRMPLLYKQIAIATGCIGSVASLQRLLGGRWGSSEQYARQEKQQGSGRNFRQTAHARNFPGRDLYIE
jgi:hypothetical protein